MTSWQELLAAAVLVLLALTFGVRSAIRKARDRKWRAAERKLTTVLQPKETIKCICPQKKGRVILTSKRLLWETGTGFTAVPLKDIKRVQGNTKDKKNTTAVSQMVSLTVKAAEDHLIYNTSEEFSDLAKVLKDKVKKQNARKKKKR